MRRETVIVAGLLAAVAVGVGARVLGRRAEVSARRGLIDWEEAERLAASRVRNAPGALSRRELETADPIYAAAMARIVPALSEALETDLVDIVERSGVVDRETWVHANVDAFRSMMHKVEGDMLAQMVPPGAGLFKAGAAIAGRAVSTRQIGYLLSFLGKRVLGQYDIALLSAEATPGRLMFVDENIRRVAGALEVPLDPFRTWIALHETTHAFEFEAHPWLRPYMAGRLERQIASLSDGVSMRNGEVIGRLGRALRGIGSGDNWMEGLMSADQQRDFRETQAVMSLIEGFSDYMMDRVGQDLVPDVETISARFHARREQKSVMERAMMRITGMDLKMEQYRKGQEFVAAVAGARGAEAIRMLWHGPETLPLPEEIELPSRWLARVLPES
ncbi:MAG TPA: zinc-dependent metalloprotease [Candidatus Limnocylindrales bacterium]